MAPTDQESNPTPADGAANSLSLLVLDDSLEDREILRRLLGSDPRRDYVVHEYTGIEEALAACRVIRPDCILLDYSLNDGTGLDFLNSLRGDDGELEFPVVMLTGSGNEQVAADAFRSGAQDYLAKGTFTPDTLQRTIAGAIYKAGAERQLREQRAELERLFHEAQEANARKDQFLAALSHELRTPLTPVLAAVSSQSPHDLSREELEDIFETVRRNVMLEARLIDDLLDLTRIAKGKLSLNLRVVDAHEVLEHALDTCGEEISQKKLGLSVSLQARRHAVSADPARLQQIFWNILKNAVKFTPQGGSVWVATRDTPDGNFEITVRDNGVGISAAALPNIFNAFEQGSSDVPRNFGGLGLGLAITAALVESHHGRVRAESPGPGAGSTFVVELPFAAAEANRPTPSSPQPPPALSVGICETGSRILLIEDHPDTARLLTRLLRRRGHEVVQAHCVADAVEIFKKDHVQLVVSDIGLPDGDGLEVMSQIQQIRKVPAIALSGYGAEEDMARSYAAGFTEHLTKPVEWSALDAALRRISAGLRRE